MKALIEMQIPLFIHLLAFVNWKKLVRSTLMNGAIFCGSTKGVNILLKLGVPIEAKDYFGYRPLWLAAFFGQTDVVRALVTAGADVNTQRNDGSSALGFASEKGHIDIVKILLDNGAEIETRYNDGSTPLWFAAANRQTDVVRALVSAGADVNTQRDDGVSALGFASQEGYIDIVNILLTRENLSHTPLMVAAGNGQTDVVRALVSARADVNAQRNDGISALGIASQNGYIDIVNILLDNGAEIETRYNDGRTPLWFAAANGQTDVVRALVSAGADVNTRCNDGASALTIASEKGYIDIVNMFLDYSAEIETRYNNGNTPLWFAAAYGQTDVVRALVSAGADVNTQRNDGSSALGFASHEGYIDIVNTLLDNGAEIETRDSLGRTPLWFAAANGQTDVVHALVSAGADVTTQRNDGVSALGFASQEGHVDIVNVLLDKGTQIETRDNVGVTPLWFAAAYGHTDVVRALVSAGADVNAQYNDGSSVLSIASQEGYIDIVNMLLDKGAWIETRYNDGGTPLWNAVAFGQTDVVHALVSAGADVNTQRNDGVSALGFASQEGYIDIVNMLLDNGAEIETRDNVGRTPLWFAAAYGHNDVVHSLVSAGADVNAQRDNGSSALGSASEKGYIHIVNTLLDNGAEIETRDNDGQTPLLFAAACGQTDVVRALVSAGADVNAQRNDGSSALGFASEKGYVDIVNMFLDYSAKVETRDSLGRTPLQFAAAYGKTDCVRALVSAGADVNTQRNDGSSALGFASQNGYIGIVNMLLDYRAEIETRDNPGSTPLWFAAANGQTDVVRALVSAGADVNAQRNDGASALGIASQKGYIDIVNMLLDNGAEIETRYNDGSTPLWFAAANGQTDVVHALVSAGADFNTQRNDGASALGIASEKGHIDIVSILLNKGTQIKTRDNDGRTPLWFAAANGQTDVVSALVSAGADVNAQCNDGSSALGFASAKGHIDIVNILLDKGAQIGTRDSVGRTPLLFAAAFGQTDVVHVLVSAGADVNTQRNDGVSALGIASQEGYFDIVNMLLVDDAEIETRDNVGHTPLWFAAAKGQTDVVRALVSAAADINTQRNDTGSLDLLLDNSAYNETSDNLHCKVWQVARNGQPGCMEPDLDDCSSCNSSPVSGTALSGHRHASKSVTRNEANLRHLEYEYLDALNAFGQWCSRDVEEILELLIINGSCINAATHGENQSALMSAVSRGRFDVVKALIQHGADIHDRNFDNMQPVDMASYCGHRHLVEFLSSSSSHALPSPCSNLCPRSGVFVDCRRNTAMHLTTDLQAMKSLLQNGADVEAENVDGLRPIHRTVRMELVELVELLIEHGANVDPADVFGNRPLHDAVCHGLNVVQLLVQHGAKLNVQNIDGKTPLHIAIEREQSDVIVFLLSQDADVGLTDVWRNTPLHYFTSELLAVSEVAESVANILTKWIQYKCIRNIVDMPISLPITTRTASDDQCDDVPVQHTPTKVARLSYEILTQAHNVNFFCREKLETDCQGNTPLHHAVGVYGKFKMFQVRSHVSKTVEFLLKWGADINTQNKDGFTPLHVARGKEAIEVCLRHADNQSFTTITDKQGRNFWHLLFLTRTQNESELETFIRPMIATSDPAKYSVDDLSRTPLHYACMDRNPWIAERYWLAKEFIEKFSDKHVNKQDRFGRTALHYAAIDGRQTLTDMLETKKADSSIRDNYRKTSSQYAEMLRYFQTQVFLLRLMKSSSFIARHLSDVAACVRNCVVDSHITTTECKAKTHDTVRNLTGFCDSASYVIDTWHGCRYDYSDVTFRSDYHDDQLLDKQQDFATNNKETAAKPTNMFAAIQSHVDKAMEELAKAITEHDHRFACEVFPVGSAFEKTKIGCCNEFDYNFVLTEISSICKVCYSPESLPGFVLLKAKIPVYDEHLKNLFDQNGILNTRILKFKFETLAKLILSSTRFCDLTDFEFIDPVSDEDLGLTRGNVAVKPNTRVQLKFTKPVNNRHVLHPISIDLVPALRINDWWPEDAWKTELCRAGDCLIVFTQPQSKYPWIGWTQPHGFVSFARAESRLLRECHPVVKAAYIVVKRMSECFCQYKFFPSHIIKTALFWCLDEKDLLKYRSSDGSDGVQGDELLCLVQNILRRLLCFGAQDFVPDFFMPKLHRPVWHKERYLKQYHMRLYQHGLTYKDLFSLSRQQSHDEVLRSIKTMFTFSHIMYWSLLSETDDLKLFVPSAINPLFENSYDDSTQ